MIANNSSCTREMKYRIATERVAFNRKKTFFKSKIGLKIKEENVRILHLEHIIL
jgi:hypothetical protein